MSEYTLQLYTPLLSTGSTSIDDITDKALAWQRTIRSNGGPWTGKFRLEGDDIELHRWFTTRLGWHIEEHYAGACTWEGMVYEMEYVHNGVRRIRSLDTVGDGELWANAIKALYIDDSDVAQASSYATQSKSIAIFGRKEDILTLDGVPQATAEAMRDTEIKRRAWPRALFAGLTGSSQSYIDVVVCGYIFTMNWRYVSVQEGITTDDLDDYMQSIISTDCEFVSEAKTEQNTLTILRRTPVPMRAWDAIKNMVKMGDINDNRYRFYLVPGRKSVYEQIDTSPRYYLRDGQLTNVGGQVVPDWLVQPAVVRDVGYLSSGRADPDSWLGDVRDFYIDEVTVGARSGINIKSSLFEEEELRANRNEYELWMEDILSRVTVSAVGARQARAERARIDLRIF